MISTHVLDTTRGQPAAGVRIVLERVFGDRTVEVGTAMTDADGRVREFTLSQKEPGVYRLAFAIGAYFASRHIASFYPRALVEFTIPDATQRYHVPLLVSPYGYSTYRGS